MAWHIIQRGNNRSACFYAEEDYRRYLDTLKEQADKHDCQIHAYVLMTNHVHLLVTPAEVLWEGRGAVNHGAVLVVRNKSVPVLIG